MGIYEHTLLAWKCGILFGCLGLLMVVVFVITTTVYGLTYDPDNNINATLSIDTFDTFGKGIVGIFISVFFICLLLSKCGFGCLYCYDLIDDIESESEIEVT